MSREQNPPAPSRGPEHDPSCPLYVEPLRFIETKDAQGEPTLEWSRARSSSVTGSGRPHHKAVLGVVPQPRAAALSAPATALAHDLRARDAHRAQCVWSRFLELSPELESRPHEITLAFVKAVVNPPAKR